MSTMFFIQFAIVLVCILIGAQVGGIGLGVLGGIGLAVLAFGFHLEPTSPPIDVIPCTNIIEIYSKKIG